MRPMLSAEFTAAAFAADMKPWALVETMMSRPFVNCYTPRVKVIFRSECAFLSRSIITH